MQHILILQCLHVLLKLIHALLVILQELLQVGSINRMFTVMTDGAHNIVVILVAHVSGPFCLGSNAATGAFSDIPKTSPPPRLVPTDLSPCHASRL